MVDVEFLGFFSGYLSSYEVMTKDILPFNNISSENASGKIKRENVLRYKNIAHFPNFPIIQVQHFSNLQEDFRFLLLYFLIELSVPVSAGSLVRKQNFNSVLLALYYVLFFFSIRTSISLTTYSFHNFSFFACENL